MLVATGRGADRPDVCRRALGIVVRYSQNERARQDDGDGPGRRDRVPVAPVPSASQTVPGHGPPFCDRKTRHGKTLPWPKLRLRTPRHPTRAMDWALEVRQGYPRRLRSVVESTDGR